MKVYVEVGIGAWKTFKRVDLIAVPHVGDDIIVGEHQIHCDTVIIDKHEITVRETRHFQSEQDAKEFFS